ncbi:MAG TPA: hypothetical protein VIE13_01000 [Terriglobales bacterium]
MDWVSRREFPAELINLIAPVPARLLPSSEWMPRGYSAPVEAELDTFGPAHFANAGIDWPALHGWWLMHDGTTPNWDIVLTCEIEGRPGIVLVEAKANKPEMNSGGKNKDENATRASGENHDQIGAAIEEARTGLTELVPGAHVGISRDSHYQLSNRLAFTWKLARLGLPTVLVYLGFLGDEGIRDVGEPFRNSVDWQDAFHACARGVAPPELFETRLDIGPAPAWVLVRSRLVLEPSPARATRAARGASA